MNRNLILLLLLLTVTGIACKKDQPVSGPANLPVPDNNVSVLLKDMVISNLPSPYYHFEYDSNRYVTLISFAADFDVYNMQYSDKRIKHILNTKNNNQLEYTYLNNVVSMITERSGATGQKRWEFLFQYDINSRLAQISWFRFTNNGTTRVPYRKVILTYYTDGNLASFDDFSANEPGSELVWNSTTQYKDYDKSVNVDGFSIFKNFFEPLIFLPAVKFQKNNPGTEIITGAENDYTISYRYQFDDSLPVVKSGTVLQTRGVNKGQVSNISSTFRYYH